MYNKEQLLKNIQSLGIKEEDVLLVHSSMKAIGEVEGGADTVLDALMEATSNGMLVLPTHTWATMTPEHNTYNSDEEPACVGILPNLFMKRFGVVRSFHPTHSVAAYGKDAKEYVSGEEFQTTPCSRNGCYGKLYDKNAKILLLGCGLNRNTYMHAQEEWFGITERLTTETLSLQIVMPDGTLKESIMHKHFKPNGISISEYYVKIENILIEKKAMQRGKVGDADVLLLDAKMSADIFTQILKKDRDAFLDNRELPHIEY